MERHPVDQVVSKVMDIRKAVAELEALILKVAPNTQARGEVLGDLKRFVSDTNPFQSQDNEDGSWNAMPVMLDTIDQYPATKKLYAKLGIEI